MTNVTKRIKEFLGSPAGQRLIEQARQELTKPHNRERLRALAQRLTKRR
ncbi:MAG TPA: hypothetical protein VFC19_03235 [Candidatus Limnocylindrales bacterium]|nr:hypothetical protein [Candidatus Limnocylindrales bacterium]